MSRLEIRNLTVKVRLGCTPEERKIPQEVRFTVELTFLEGPPACVTDKLEDTICYAKICEALRSVSKDKEYATVEHLSQKAIENLRILLTPQIKGQLSVHKVSPPIDNLLDGVVLVREIH